MLSNVILPHMHIDMQAHGYECLFIWLPLRTHTGFSKLHYAQRMMGSHSYGARPLGDSVPELM
jgi:hypothetical protein